MKPKKTEFNEYEYFNGVNKECHPGTFKPGDKVRALKTNHDYIKDTIYTVTLYADYKTSDWASVGNRLINHVFIYKDFELVEENKTNISPEKVEYDVDKYPWGKW